MSGVEEMKDSVQGQFKGELDLGGNLDLSADGVVPFLIVNERPISLRACCALTPDMVRVLEILALPENNGGVFRVDREGEAVRLTRVGVAGHVANKLASALPRRKIPPLGAPRRESSSM